MRFLASSCSPARRFTRRWWRVSAPAFCDPDGSVNRARLAELAFGGPSQPTRVQELNQIVHPAVIRRQEEWMAEVGRRDPHAVAVVEAALILEARMANRF